MKANIGTYSMDFLGLSMNVITGKISVSFENHYNSTIGGLGYRNQHNYDKRLFINTKPGYSYDYNQFKYLIWNYSK